MNVMIIDDQKDVVKSFKNGINWEKLHIDQVYTAFSAREARKLFDQYQVDIMLSDIEMPEENGLSLLQWVRENRKEVECIFLTSYADFGYAKEAIRLESYDYILQPARFEEVEAALRKVYARIRQKQKLTQLEQTQDFLKTHKEVVLDSIFEKMLVSEDTQADDLFQKFRGIFQKQFQNGCYFCADFQIVRWIKNQEEWNDKLIKLVLYNVLEEIFQEVSCDVLISHISTNDFFALFYGEYAEFSYEIFRKGICRAHDFIRKNMEFETAVYISNLNEKDLYQSIQRLASIRQDNVMKLPEVFEEISKRPDNEKMYDSLQINQWRKRINNGEGALVKNAISRFLKGAQREKVINIEMMKTLHYEFSKAVFSIFERKQLNSQSIFTMDYSYEKYMCAYQNYEALMEAIEYCLTCLHNIPQEREEVDPVAIAQKYILDNINKNISRSEVAQHVYLNEEYFSRMFKNKTGYAYKDYAIEVKMKYIKELLVTTNFSISIIASKAGFDNFSYFSRMFKKMEHMTPQEYRQLHKGQLI